MEAAPAAPSCSASTGPPVTLAELQRVLKEQSADLTNSIREGQSKLQTLKRELTTQVKQNYVFQRDLTALEEKISLVIKNQMRAETLTQILSSSSSSSTNSAQDLEATLYKISPVWSHLFYLLQKDPKYLATLTRLILPAQIDSFLSTTVLTLYGDQYEDREENLLLSLFKLVLHEEYRVCPDVPQFMRSNTAFTKMLGTFNKRGPYRKYLFDTLQQPLQEMLAQDDLILEVNPSKIYTEYVANYEKNNNGKKYTGPAMMSNEEIEKIPEIQKLMKKRFEAIQATAEMFVGRVFNSVKEVPYGMRYLCKKIKDFGLERFPGLPADEVNVLVGGFIFLRFFSPAIATPDAESFGLVSGPLSPNQRRNCTLICKLIQNLSNRIRFGEKEQFMLPLNGFLDRYSELITGFFNDLCAVDELEDRMELDTFRELAAGEEPMINIYVNEALLLHKLVLQHVAAIAPTPSDPLHIIIQEMKSTVSLLSSSSPPSSPSPSSASIPTLPESVSKEQNYSFNLRLKNKFRSDEDIARDASFTVAQKVLEELKEKICFALRNSLDSHLENTSLSVFLKAAKEFAKDNEDFALAAEFKSILQTLETLEAEGVIESGPDGRYNLLLQSIHTDVLNRVETSDRIAKQIERLLDVQKDLQKHATNFQERANMYKQVLADARAKLFQPKLIEKKANGSGRALVVGPFKLKLSQLEKDGVVVVSATIPDFIRRKSTLTISSTQPGVFHVVATVSGVTALTDDFDITELLEMQKSGAKVLDKGEVTMNLQPLINLLNKLFLSR